MRFRTTTRDDYTTYSYYVTLLNRLCVKLDRKVERILERSWNKAHGDQ